MVLAGKLLYTLDQPGEGTFIKRGCPEAPFIWPAGLQAAALSSTSFGQRDTGYAQLRRRTLDRQRPDQLV